MHSCNLYNLCHNLKRTDLTDIQKAPDNAHEVGNVAVVNGAYCILPLL